MYTERESVPLPASGSWLQPTEDQRKEDREHAAAAQKSPPRPGCASADPRPQAPVMRTGWGQRSAQCQRPDLAEDGPHFQDLTTTAVSRRSWRKALRHPWVSGIAASGSRREEGDWVMGREYVALNRADAKH